MRQSRVRANYYAVLSMKPHFWGRTIKPVCLWECAYLHTPINMYAATATTTAAWKILACNSICKTSRRLLAAAPQVHMVNLICWPTSRKTERKNNKAKSMPEWSIYRYPAKTHVMCCVNACKYSTTSINTLTDRSLYAKKYLTKYCKYRWKSNR